MPIYEYRCSSCGHELEALQKLSDARLITCPSCHADALTKQVSAAGFQLKGTGWYVTDFRNGSKPARDKDAKPANDSDARPAEAGAESKAADVKAGEAKSGEAKSDESKSASKVADTATAAAKPAESSVKAATAPTTGSGTSAS